MNAYVTAVCSNHKICSRFSCDLNILRRSTFHGSVHKSWGLHIDRIEIALIGVVCANMFAFHLLSTVKWSYLPRETWKRSNAILKWDDGSFNILF